MGMTNGGKDIPSLYPETLPSLYPETLPCCHPEPELSEGEGSQAPNIPLFPCREGIFEQPQGGLVFC